MSKRTAPYNRAFDGQINIRLPKAMKDAFESAVGKGRMNEAILNFIRRTIAKKAGK